jgi:putative Holliday junction resolvase
MKILGLDYGKARIGLAVSDESGVIATPLCVIERTSLEADLGRIAAAATQHQAARIAVGMPINLDGTRGLAARDVARFTELLAARVSIPIEPWDERLTTAQAERAMIDSDMSRRRRKQRIDAVAAQLMLQSYLDAGRGKC